MLTIAITGAGPVGLTLARLLLPYTSHKTSTPKVQITIFEKDASSTSRTSIGGSLDLHPKTGLAAIRACELYSEFEKYARFEGEEMRICDQNGFCYIHQIDVPESIAAEHARPEIDRVKLMEILLASVPHSMIRWGKQVKDVIEGEKGRWSIDFVDGTTEGPFDLVVGADGAWSKARKALTDVEPAYSGVCGVTVAIDAESAGDSWDAIQGMIGKGNNFSFSHGQSCMGQRQGSGDIKASFYQRREIEWINELNQNCKGDDKALKKILLDEYKDWVPEFQQWIVAAKNFWCHPLWELPIGHRFEHKAGLTLIGDAAHLMTPFAGEGVNAGMRDALDLAETIKKTIDQGQDFDNQVAEFEESMFVRMQKFMTETQTNKNTMYALDAPYSFFTAMVGQVAEEFGYPLNKGLLWFVPVKGFVSSVIRVMGSYGALRRRIRKLFKAEKQIQLL